MAMTRWSMSEGSTRSRRAFLFGLGAAACIASGSNDGASQSVHRRPTILDAPSNLGLMPPSPGKEPGVKLMAQALRAHGIVSRLSAEDAGEVVPPKCNPAIDPTTKIRNPAAIRAYSVQLADRLGVLLDEGRFPLVLGGDCSILLGSALAFARRGRHGLLFIDGHTDLLTPETSHTGGAAGMDLALATGTGPHLLTAIGTAYPYFQPRDVVVFGYRWPAPGENSPAAPQKPMTGFPLSAIRKLPVSRSVETAVNQFENAGLKFWVHVDLDVLAPEWMAAVDSPDPGGMTPEELTTTLRTAVRSKYCVGMEATIYDPTRDSTGKAADLILNVLSQTFS
jgi:arginase